MASPKREHQRSLRQARIEAQQAQVKRQKTKSIAFKVIGGVLALVLIGILIAVFSKDDTKATPPITTTTTSSTVPGQTTTTTAAAPVYGTTACPAATGVAAPVTTFSDGPAKCIADDGIYTATFDTSEGKVVVQLDQKRAPMGVNNFVFLARNKYYDNTSIFRTDPSIDIIQGGSPHTQSNSDVGPGYTLNDDPKGFKYTEGDLVLARTNAPNSGGGQFFFATGPNVNKLDAQGTYVTLGKATSGVDVLKKIIALNSGTGQLGGKPSKDVVVKTVTIQEKLPAGSTTTTASTTTTVPSPNTTTTSAATTTTTAVASTTTKS